MCEIYTYILNDLKKHEESIGIIKNKISKQAAINYFLGTIIFTGVAYIMTSDMLMKKQNLRINKLQSEIEELKQKEGENNE